MKVTEADEYMHFIRFYTIFSSELSSLELNSEQIEGLAYDTVFNDDKFKEPARFITSMKNLLKWVKTSDLK